MLIFNLFLLRPNFFYKLLITDRLSHIALLNLMPLNRMIIRKVIDFNMAFLLILGSIVGLFLLVKGYYASKTNG